MAVLRQGYQNDIIASYIGTLGVFLAVLCSVLMLRFKGFKAVFNVAGKHKEIDINDVPNAVSIKGVYRADREEFYGYGSLAQSPNSRITPMMVKLPPNQNELRTTKSEGNLTQPEPMSTVRSSTLETTLQPQAATSNNSRIDKTKQKQKSQQDKENKKIEKQKAAEQKKRDKIAASEQAKSEKLKRDKEKREAQQQAKEAKKKVKAPQTQPAPKPRNNPLAQSNPLAQPNPLTQTSYSTNTLESSISKTSGPPPYEENQKSELTKNKKDATGNTSFSKPVEEDSWDLVSKHREQMVRPTSNIGGGQPKQMVLDLQFDRMGPAAAVKRRDDDDDEADA